MYASLCSSQVSRLAATTSPSPARYDVAHLHCAASRGQQYRPPTTTPSRCRLGTTTTRVERRAVIGSLLESGRDVLPGPAQPFQGTDRACRHRSGAWAATALRTDALCGVDGLEVIGGGWADLEAVEPRPEADRYGGTPYDLARAGAQARANYGGLFRSMSQRKSQAGMTLSRKPTA